MNRSTKIAGMAGMALAGGAAVLAFRRKPQTPAYGRGIKLKKSVTVNRPAAELYRHWRNLESLPALVRYLDAVSVEDAKHSSWKIALPGGVNLSWRAEITVDRENEMIGWRSLPDSDVDLAGSIRFGKTAGGRGTVVRVALQYNPPAGKFGSMLATRVGENPGAIVEETLRRFKQFMETGEVATAKGDNIAYFKPIQALRTTEPVQAASEDSFPASDPPSWTGTTGTTGN